MREDIVIVAGRHYRRATWPRRIMGRILDLVFLAFLTAICALVDEGLAAISLILSFFYLLLGNGLLGGQSIGKRLTGQMVIETRYGGPCGLVQDGMRHKYLLFLNLFFLVLIAYDSAQGCFETPETYVVLAKPLTPSEMDELKETPAKLDLAGLRTTVRQIQKEGRRNGGGKS